MSISLTCPHCHADLAVHDRLAGKETRCPHCGGAIEVPLQSEAPSQVRAALVEDNAAEFVEVEDVVMAEVDNAKELVADEDIVAVEDIEAVEDVVIAEGEDDNSGAVVLGSGPSNALSAASPVVEQAVRPREPQNADDNEEEKISFPAKELPKDDMDMTPMVDVTFLLLIFFMITASFSSEKAFDEPPPQSDAVPTEKREDNLDKIRVQIDEFNAYTVIFSGGDEREASSKQELLIALDEAKSEVSTGKNDDELSLFIEAHTECIHSAVIAALDAARDKGFNKFQVQVVEEFQ